MVGVKAKQPDFTGIESRFKEMDADGSGFITEEDWNVKKEMTEI